MLPRDHAKAAVVLAAVLLPRMGPGAALAGAAAVLIDVDHYAWYVAHFRRWRIGEAYRFFRSPGATRAGSMPSTMTLLHTVEVLGVLGAVAARRRPLRPVLLGMLVHLGLDALDDLHVHGGLTRAYSLLWDMVRPRGHV